MKIFFKKRIQNVLSIHVGFQIDDSNSFKTGFDWLRVYQAPSCNHQSENLLNITNLGENVRIIMPILRLKSTQATAMTRKAD